MDSFCNCLRYDRFIKVVDVSYNLIPERSLKNFINQALKENNTIVSFAAHRNPGLTDNCKKKIALCLLKNIEYFKSNGIEIKEEWIKPENFTLKIPEKVL